MNMSYKNYSELLDSDRLRATQLVRSAGPCSPLPLSQPSFRVSALKIQVVGLSATLVPDYKPMRQHILQNSELHGHCWENFTSAINSSYFVLRCI
jgi:hypothetical protein